MRDDIESRFYEIMESTIGLEDGLSKLALLEEAARLADVHNRIDLGFEARMGLVHTATFSGAPEKALVAFSWCLAQYDREPDQFDEFNLLWQYKWIADSLVGFPQVSRERIEAMFQDMGRRFEQAGAGPRSLAKRRCKAALAMGDPEAARLHHQVWTDARTDWLSDCLACDRDDEVEFLAATGLDERAIEWAAPILRGRMRCAEVPHLTLSRLLRPLLRLGRPEEAMELHRRGYRLVSRNANFLREVARHLGFVILTDNLSRAVKHFEIHFPWALKTVDLDRKFAFYQAARLLIDRLAERTRRTENLRLPREFPGYREEGTYELETLASWLDDQRRDLAARFDARNGNDAYTRALDEPEALKALVTPFPFTRPRSC